VSRTQISVPYRSLLLPGGPIAVTDAIFVNALLAPSLTDPTSNPLFSTMET